jgi:hypothetical protein
MKRVDKSTMREFIAYIGRGFKEGEEVPAEIMTALRELADWIISEWVPRGSKTKEALGAFGWWFPHEALGDTHWRLRLLERAAKATHNVDNTERVLKTLKLMATTEPAGVVNCLALMVKRSSEEMGIHYLATESEGILADAQEVGNGSVKRKIAEIADYFGIRGYLQYRRFA